MKSFNVSNDGYTFKSRTVKLGAVFPLDRKDYEESSMEEGQEGTARKETDLVINMLGEKVALGPLRRELIPLYQRWDNDFAVLRTLHIPRPSTYEEAQAGYEQLVAAERKRHVVYFTIYEKTNFQPIGTTALDDINYRDRTASFGLLIGEVAFRGCGYGTETTRLMLDYAFLALGLHNISLTVWEYNLAGQRAYAKAGFREFGRQRQAKFMGGKLWDIVYMECISTEFASPLLYRILVPDTHRA